MGVKVQGHRRRCPGGLPHPPRARSLKDNGAIIIGALLDELERQDKTVGLATLCIASGMGAATIIERV